jgi:hypothetical protein
MEEGPVVKALELEVFDFGISVLGDTLWAHQLMIWMVRSLGA